MKTLTMISQLNNKLNFVHNKLKMGVLLFMLSFVADNYAQSKHALLIGISDYGNVMENPDEWANISGANDVRMLTPKFTKQGFQVDSIVNAQATCKNITNALSNLAKSCKTGDLVYIHFSMHGQPVEDLNGDEEDGWDEALIPVDAKMKFQKGVYEGENHLLDDILEKHFTNIREKIGKTGFLYVVLDACHSGTASRGYEEHVRGVREGFSPSEKDYTPDRTKKSNDYFKIPTNANQAQVIILEACRSYQQNREIYDRETNISYGPLSYSVSQTIKEQLLGKDPSWIERVKSLMKKIAHSDQDMVIEKSQ